MKNLTIKSANFYNNAQGKLSINLSDGSTMSANLLESDKKKLIKKEVKPIELTDKYFTLVNGKYVYSNPK